MGRTSIYRAVYDLRPAFVAAVRAGLDAADLAKALGCTRSYLYRLQKGTRRPSRVMAERLAGATGVPVQTLIVGVEGPAPDGEETAHTPSGGHVYGQV